MLTIQTIVLPTDGSATAEAARSVAEQFADRYGAELHVLRVEIVPPAGDLRYNAVPEPFEADSPFFGLPVPEDVTVRAQVPDTGNDEALVVEHRDPMIWVSEATAQRSGGWITGVADVVPADHGPFAMNRGDLRITVIGSLMAVELSRCTG